MLGFFAAAHAEEDATAKRLIARTTLNHARMIVTRPGACQNNRFEARLILFPTSAASTMNLTACMRVFIATLFGFFLSTALAAAADRPNILWITCEDISPNLGCYGDTYAITPNLDAFAVTAMRYTNAISNAPVCAP